MVQIQSTWFPLVARNPQKFMTNYKQGAGADFQKATERVYHSAAYPSRVVLPVWKGSQMINRADTCNGRDNQ